MSYSITVGELAPSVMIACRTREHTIRRTRHKVHSHVANADVNAAQTILAVGQAERRNACEVANLSCKNPTASAVRSVNYHAALESVG